MSAQPTEPEVQNKTEDKAGKEKPPATRGRGRAFLIFFIVLAIAATAGIFYWLHSRQFETTDDAQVEAHLNSVSARVEGTILKVYVENNDRVTAGAPLVDLDPRDYQVALDQTHAQLAQSHTMIAAALPNIPITELSSSTDISSGEAEVANAQAALSSAQQMLAAEQARLAQAEANNEKAQADLARYKTLIAKEEVSKQEYDSIAAAAKAQAAGVTSSQASVASDEQVVNQRRAQVSQAQDKLSQSRKVAPRQLALRQAAVASEQAAAKTSEVQVERAQLDLSYTKILAPVSGIVMKRSAEGGAHVAVGQQLMLVAQTTDLWVTANFKETQLRHLRPNQSAVLHVDALDEDFEGYVEDIGGATGAITSVLPPENATGNYVKVVQRVPVRLRFKAGQKDMEHLRPGMSVEPEVRIGN